MSSRIYLEFACVISIVSCLFIIISYSHSTLRDKKPKSLIPLNRLLVWKSVADLVYCIRYLFPFEKYIASYDVPYIWEHPIQNCLALAWTTQVFGLASEVWFFLFSVDLYAYSTNPFINLDKSVKQYHGFAWGLGVISASLLLRESKALVASEIAHHRFMDINVPDTWTPAISNFYDSKRSLTLGNYCVFTDADILFSWTLYYGIVILLVLGTVGILLLEQRAHPKGSGRLDTLRTREKVIRSIRFVTVANSIYQGICLVLWIAGVYYLERVRHIAALVDVVQNVTAMFTGLKGLIDLISWIAINGVPQIYSGSTHGDLPIRQDSFEEEMEAQLNVALRQEVLFFTTRGIIAATANAEKTRSKRKVVKLCIHELCLRIRFNDYAPATFSEIRQGFKLTQKSYLDSFSRTCHERIQQKAGGGSSGAFMFYTADYNYIVKSVTREERRVLLRMLPSYLEHLKRNPNSYLTRFYGCHSIHMYGQSFSFVVMSNVIGKVSMHQFYDIKGSWVDRNAEAIVGKKILTCTYCGFTFQANSTEICEYSVRGNHMPHVVLKDNDFRKKLRISKEKAEALVCQIQNDSSFLCEMGIMDYSLLLSVHSKKYPVDEDALVVESGPSKRKVNIQSPTQERAAMNGGIKRTAMRSRYSMVYPDDDDDCDECVNNHVVAQSPSPCYNIEETPLLGNGWTGDRNPAPEGYKACAIVGPDYYTFGIIDILQTWTWSKRLERIWKVYIMRKDKNGISAAPPKLYAERFHRRIEDIAMLPHPTDVGLYYH